MSDADSTQIARAEQAAGHYARGLLLAGQGQQAAAAESFRAALALEGSFLEASSGLAATLVAQGRIDEAIEFLSDFAQRNPNCAQAHYNLSIPLLSQRRFDEAIASCRKALALDPHYAPAHNNLGVAVLEQHDPAQAAAGFRRAIELAPDYAEAHLNLGVVLTRQGHFEQAASCYMRAVQIRPDFSDARYRLAVALAEQNKPQEAAVQYQEVLARRPDDADAHMGLAVALFHLGRWAEAWPHFEWRFRCRGGVQPELPLPHWTGSDLTGRTILLAAEQGIGDTLQFLRYAALLQRRGATVILECEPSVARLAARAAGVDRVLARGQPRPRADAHAWLLSVPGMVGTTLENVPAEIPYLTPDADLAARWRSELGGHGKLRVGIAWQGNPLQPKDRFRSIALGEFEPLARIDGVQLFSLQYGPGREQLKAAPDLKIVDLGESLADLDNVAAIVSNLDLVITCDSAPAHLAGALGARTWVALAYTADWRWMLDRPDTPWYPTMRLFRQTRREDWGEVFQRIRQELASMMT